MNSMDLLNNNSDQNVIIATNRHAGNRLKEDRNKHNTIFKVDYLRLSIPDVFRDIIQSKIEKITGHEWKVCKKVRGSSYRKALRCGNVTLSYANRFKKPRFSLNIPSSAHPDRYISMVPWLVSEGTTVRRIDLAIDDLGGLTTMRKIIPAFERKEIIGRFKKANIIWDFRTQYKTLQIGSRFSDSFIRAYEKPFVDVLEYQNMQRADVFMRWEVELKNKQAQKFIENCFLQKDKFSRCFPINRDKKILLKVLNFEIGKIFVKKISIRNLKGHTNISRAHYYPWWKNFVLSIVPISPENCT